MTADAVSTDTTVVECGIGEAIGVVTVVAGIAALNMVRRFTRRCAAVMAADAGTLHFSVVDLGNNLPARWCMTGFTQIGGGNVV